MGTGGACPAAGSGWAGSCLAPWGAPLLGRAWCRLELGSGAGAGGAERGRVPGPEQGTALGRFALAVCAEVGALGGCLRTAAFAFVAF